MNAAACKTQLTNDILDGTDKLNLFIRFDHEYYFCTLRASSVKRASEQATENIEAHKAIFSLEAQYLEHKRV